VLLRAAPVGMGRVMLAKVFGGLILVTLVTWAATLALALSHAGPGCGKQALRWWPRRGWRSAQTIAAVAGAALTVDFEGDNPQRRIGCLGTIVTFLRCPSFSSSRTQLSWRWWVTRSALSVPRPLLAFHRSSDWGLPVFALASVAPSSWPPV